MSDVTKDRNLQIAESLLPHLYPLILDRLKNDGLLVQDKPKRKVYKTYPSGVYFPELDYLRYVRTLLGEMRTGRYSLGNNIKTYSEAEYKDYTYAVLVEGGSHALGNAFTDLVVPSATLRRDIGIPYEVDWRQAYNNQGSESKYLRGVLDGNMDITKEVAIKNSAATYTFRLTDPITPDVIHNTRDQWQRMTPEEKSRRIVSEDTMMALLDAFESQRAMPFHISWEVHITESGESLEKIATRGGHTFEHTKPNGGLTLQDRLLTSAMRSPLKIHADHQLGTSTSRLDFEAEYDEE